MRRLLFGVFFLTLLSSCDDGEIIVTTFDFEDSTVRFCEGTNKNVFYAVNDDEVFESISLEFRRNILELNEEGRIIPPDDEEISFNLSGSGSTDSRIVYRIFRSEVPNDYFCNVVPPREPVVVEEWISGTGATVFIRRSFSDETPNADADGDGIDNEDEGWNAQGIDLRDTDNDGIADYLDVDDDGDNVETRRERTIEPADDDGIPNYLDDDDDNDGILTRFEVEEGNEENPTLFTTAEGIPNYLNPEQTSELIHDEYIENDITRNYSYRIVVEDLKFTKQDGSGESIQYEVYDFGNYAESGIEVILCPNDDLDCGEPETDETDETEDN